MPQLRKLYQGQVAATATLLYTAGFPVRITRLTAVNTDTSARTLKLWFGGSDNANVILPATSLDASGGRAESGGGILLDKGDVLYAQASAASAITLTIWGEVATDGQALSGGDGAAWTVFDTSGREKAVQAVGELADVGDVTITSVADNEVLAYDNGSSTWINQTAAEAALATSTHTHAIDDLDDVTIDTIADDEVLMWSTDTFVNQTFDEAGIIKWLGKDTSDVSNPPTDAELDAAFGEPGTVGDAMGILDDNGGGANIYLCISDGTNWFTVTLAQAA